MKKNLKVPATFRYVAFLDLLIDAAYQHRLATQVDDPFAMSRHVRASVSAAFLTIECVANCLLEIVEVPDALRDELDKLKPLAKIEIALRMRGKFGYDRGRSEVQRAVEVIKVRNDYVHSKATKVDAAVQEPEDAGPEWMVPFSIHPEHWKTLKIPKQSIFWSADVSRGILHVVRDFLSYILIDILRADEDLLSMMLTSQLVFGGPGASRATMPAVFDEYKREIAWLKERNIDFSFLKVVSAPTPSTTLHQVIRPQNFVDRFGRRVLTNDGRAGRDGREGVGSPTEELQGRVAAAIYANCERLDDAQLDEIVTWVSLYRSSR